VPILIDTRPQGFDRVKALGGDDVVCGRSTDVAQLPNAGVGHGELSGPERGCRLPGVEIDEDENRSPGPCLSASRHHE